MLAILVALGRSGVLAQEPALRPERPGADGSWASRSLAIDSNRFGKLKSHENRAPGRLRTAPHARNDHRVWEPRFERTAVPQSIPERLPVHSRIARRRRAGHG